MSMCEMEWREVIGFPSYEVSEFGDVRRVSRANGKPCMEYLPGTVSYGYRCFLLAERERVYKKCRSHRLVCRAWHGEEPDGRPYVAHGDGDRLNNHFSNLRWVSAKENEVDKRGHGRAPIGERHPGALLNDDDVRAIRGQYQGVRGDLPRLGKLFGVSPSTIFMVVKRRTWTHLA